MKLYEVECERNNVSPKEFFNYCKKRMETKGADLETWIDSYDEWEKPLRPEQYHTNDHLDWDEPQREAYKMLPFEMQIFLQGSYNFIMEFEFDTEKKGHGYMYAVEMR